MTMELRVLGAPGFGKTTRLAERICKAVDLVGPSGVLVFSYTKAAAHEIAARKITVDPNNVGTLHAMCYRSLGMPKLTEGELKSWNDRHPTLALVKERGKSALDDPFAGGEGGDDGAVATSETYHRLRNQGVGRELWPKNVQHFASKWEEWKKENTLLDFTDLIETAYFDMDRAPGGASVAFVDEAQDLTPMQAAILRKLAE